MRVLIVGLNRQRIILYRLFVFGDTNLFKCISIEIKKRDMHLHVSFYESSIILLLLLEEQITIVFNVCFFV